MDFIEIYDNSLTKKQCDNIIELFEYHSDAHHKGKAGGNYDPKKKKGKALDFSVDQTIWDAKDRALASIILYPLHKALGKFKKKYPWNTNGRKIRVKYLDIKPLVLNSDIRKKLDVFKTNEHWILDKNLIVSV